MHSGRDPHGGGGEKGIGQRAQGRERKESPWVDPAAFMIFSSIPFFPPRFGNKHKVERQELGLKRLAGQVEKNG
jgi:hypothetical protein